MTIHDPDGYKIIDSENTSTDNTINVTGGTHNITLSGVNIRGASSTAFYIEPAATVNLTLDGESSLTGGSDCAGLHVPNGAALNIYGSGLLTATGGTGKDTATTESGNGGAGIQGSVNVVGGTLIVAGGNGGSGTRTSSSGKSVAGIVTANPTDFVIKAVDSASSILYVLTSPATTEKKYMTVAQNEQVAFQRVDGYVSEIEPTTTALILTFSSDVEGLSANDITLTGATKGTLTKEAGTGKYKLDISNITVANHGYVTVAVAKAGFIFMPANKDVMLTTPSTPPVPAPIQYAILKGQGSEWTKSSENGLGITVDANYSKFTNVSVDGVTISNDKYTSESGSTIITLKSTCLNTLSVGRHTLRVNFTDGYAETSITVKAAGSPGIPATGDNSQLVLCLGIALLAVVAFVASLVLQRKRQ